eukprot:c7661_g1_i2.p1 GENE.c7661_g1_i2~~c7661_g1_i2.p1  ORF type:complete len:246 (-),score=64.21 c7661_g1_i2:163-900(-)
MSEVEQIVQRILFLSGINSALVSSSNESAFTRCLLAIARTEPKLFLRVLGITDRSKCRVHDVIVKLLREDSWVLAPHLPEVVDIILKPLASASVTREGLINDATFVLKEMVKRYPQVSFEIATQKFACSGEGGQIVVFDLRHATRWLEISGADPVSALCFSPTGDRIASLSTPTSTLRVWSTSPSFLQMLQDFAARRKLSSPNVIREVSLLKTGQWDSVRLTWGQEDEVYVVARDGSVLHIATLK